MLCALCTTFTTDIAHRHHSSWKRLEDNQWYAFKHGDCHYVRASAAAGCALCHLFDVVRSKHIPAFADLAEKWQVQHAMIDVSVTDTRRQFQLLSQAPQKSWIPFEFFRPAEVELPESSDNLTLLPKAVASDPLSVASLDVVRSWVDDCCGRHPDCPDRVDVCLPTRVIDVGSIEKKTSPSLCISEGRNGQYVTLSHCWGAETTSRLVTLKANIDRLREAILPSEIPKTFQDAVNLTRSLGYRYLWIDALCIIQDDADDWRREAAAMCDIYENAALSISALAASDSHSGMLGPRKGPSCMISVDGISIGVREQLPFLDAALQASKLESRAWCMQERILAPVILHVGQQQYYWECRAGRRHESDPRALARVKVDPTSATSDGLSHVTVGMSRSNLLDLWYDLVGRYSGRQLTRSSDRLPAIAGLAQKIGNELGQAGCHTSGLWQDDLAVGLLWHRPLQRMTRLIPSRPHFYLPSAIVGTGRYPIHIAPSWSWASLPGSVTYEWRRQFRTHHPSRRDIRFDMVSIATNRGALQAVGLVKRGACIIRMANTPGNRGDALFKSSGSLLVDDGIACILDEPQELTLHQCYCLRVSTWSGHVDASREDNATARLTFYLLLQRLEASENVEISLAEKRYTSLGRFQRVGLGYDAVGKVERVFANAAEYAIEII